MRNLEAPWAVGIGVALVLLTNAAMLGAAAWNRSGEASATLELTERELAMPLFRDKDDTGLTLALRFSDRLPLEASLAAELRRAKPPRIEYAWLDEAKLRELGFDTARAASCTRPDAGAQPPGFLARPAYVVCELDGDAWRAWLGQRERQVRALRDRVDRGSDEKAELADAEALLAIDRISRSRLMPIDAGRDPARLRELHPDRGRFAIIPASVSIGTDESGKIEGRIDGPEESGIHVPLALLPRLETFAPRQNQPAVFDAAREQAAKGWPEPVAPRYRATVNFGRGYRAWLADARELGR